MFFSGINGNRITIIDIQVTGNANGGEELEWEGRE